MRRKNENQLDEEYPLVVETTATEDADAVVWHEEATTAAMTPDDDAAESDDDAESDDAAEQKGRKAAPKGSKTTSKGGKATPKGDKAAAQASDADDVPTAQVADGEERRSPWKMFSSEDLPQVSLREILGGDYLIGDVLRRNIGFVLFLVALGVAYITNRYLAQQEVIEEERLRAELIEKKNYALTQYAQLTSYSRQSNLENRLRELGDTTLTTAAEPPFIIRVKPD